MQKIIPDSYQACKVTDGDLCPSGNVSDCSDLLQPLLCIPDKLGQGDAGVVKAGDSQEQAVVTLGARLTQSKVVRSPDPIHCFLLILCHF